MDKGSLLVLGLGGAGVAAALAFGLSRGDGERAVTAAGSGSGELRGMLSRVAAIAPADCTAVAVIDVRAMFKDGGVFSLLTAKFGEIGKAMAALDPKFADFAEPARLRQRVIDSVKRQFGIDVGSTDRVAMVRCPSGNAAVTTADGTSLPSGRFARVVDGLRVVAETQEAVSAFENARARGPALATGEARARLDKYKGRPELGSAFLVSLVLNRRGDDEIKVRDFTIAAQRVGDRLRVFAATFGDEATLTRIKAVIEEKLKELRGMLRVAPPGMPAQLAKIDMVDRLLDQIKLVRNGDMLSITLEPDVEGVTQIGVMAAIAIPAFIKYVQRSKTSEATMNVRKLYDASVSYFEEEHASKTGQIVPRQFPPSTDWTPPGSPCGQPGGKWQPNPKLWQHPTWTALNFSVDDPHYYSYQYVSSGTGTDAKFSVRARGDLNCDGTFSLFERVGTVDSEGNVSGGAGLYKHQPLE